MIREKTLGAPIPVESTRLRLVIMYFVLTGVVGAIGLSGLVVLALLKIPAANDLLSERPWVPLTAALHIVTNFGIGFALSRRSRVGAVFALFSFLLPLIGAALRYPVPVAAILFSVVGLLATASVWREMRTT